MCSKPGGQGAGWAAAPSPQPGGRGRGRGACAPGCGQAGRQGPAPRLLRGEGVLGPLTPCADAARAPFHPLALGHEDHERPRPLTPQFCPGKAGCWSFIFQAHGKLPALGLSEGEQGREMLFLWGQLTVSPPPPTPPQIPRHGAVQWF